MTNNKPRYNVALFKWGIFTLQCFCCCEWFFGREVRGSFHKAKPAAVQKNTVKPAAIEIKVRVYYNDYGNHRNNTKGTRF